MILHLSQKLAKAIRCELSLPGENIDQAGLLHSWSGDLFSLPKQGRFVLLMNDASLYPIIIPLKQGMHFPKFLETFLQALNEVYIQHEAEFDPHNLSVLATRRTNRKIIGSMNNAVFLIQQRQAYRFSTDDPVNLQDHCRQLARTPFNSVEGHFPDKRFAQLLAES